MQLSERDRRVYRNDFAKRCFRETADKDYIAARASYRFGLVEPFLWSALQATEKYLKAILLYNNRSTKDLNHDVAKAFDRVMQITYLDLDFPNSLAEFLRYLTRHASSRYLERSYYTRGRELLQLDFSIWHLRRYCQDMRAAPTGVDEALVLEISLRDISLDMWADRPHRFRLSGGYLEEVLDGRHGREVREALVWKNSYYGARYRRSLRNYKLRSQSANPPHYLHRESYFAVKDLVRFSKDVVAEVLASRTGA